MLTFFVIFIGIVTLFKPIVGIISLLLLECSFVLPSVFTNVSFIITGTSSATILILCLFVRAIISYKSKTVNKFDARLLIILIGWLFASASIAFLTNQSTKWDLIAVTLQTAIFYILPLAVSTLSAKERKLLANITILLAVLFALIHLDILWTKNGKLVAKYYFLPKGMNDAYGVSENIATSSGMFYVPRASALIMITTAFLAGRILLKSYKNVYGLFLLLSSLVICLICSISFAQRSFVLILPLVMLIYAGLSFKRRGGIATVFVMVILVGGGYAVIRNASAKSNFTAVMEKRLAEAAKVGSLDPRNARIAANRDALESIVESPLWGIGSIVSSTRSQDAHSILRVGFMGGLPAILMVLVWISTLFLRFAKLLKKCGEPNLGLCLSAFCAVMCACLMMLLNTVPYLFYSMNLVPFGIFVGLFISEYTDMANSRMRNDSVKEPFDTYVSPA
ncbi:hypothetical protein [Geobacter grbiciae]|uniref:hypothetical protein n=1 Tax=Geobacter grbiciae TaxID=155042 RepID=UPI001C02B848|nr:hypothetical protein [Geobacter grbiciae]MBT1075764.1 hypothetical protein [Geobacter grbiciae]